MCQARVVIRVIALFLAITATGVFGGVARWLGSSKVSKRHYTRTARPKNMNHLNVYIGAFKLLEPCLTLILIYHIIRLELIRNSSSTSDWKGADFKIKNGFAAYQ